MKSNKNKQRSQRRIIQQKLDHFTKLNEPIPSAGWVKAIRGSLGLTIRQLAERIGVGHSAITQLEKREPKKRVTLESLEQVARAMDCKVVYAIVPSSSDETLEDIIKRRATDEAAKILKEVAHTMRLEAQGTSEKQIKDEVRRIAADLIESGDSRIWNSNNKKKNVK